MLDFHVLALLLGPAHLHHHQGSQKSAGGGAWELVLWSHVSALLLTPHGWLQAHLSYKSRGNGSVTSQT